MAAAAAPLRSGGAPAPPPPRCVAPRPPGGTAARPPAPGSGRAGGARGTPAPVPFPVPLPPPGLSRCFLLLSPAARLPPVLRHDPRRWPAPGGWTRVGGGCSSPAGGVEAAAVGGELRCAAVSRRVGGQSPSRGLEAAGLGCGDLGESGRVCPGRASASPGSPSLSSPRLSGRCWR